MSHNCGVPGRRNPAPFVHRPWCQATRFRRHQHHENPASRVFDPAFALIFRRSRFPRLPRQSPDTALAIRHERRRNSPRYDTAIPEDSSLPRSLHATIIRAIGAFPWPPGISRTFPGWHRPETRPRKVSISAWPLCDRGAQMRRARRKVAMMQVIWLESRIREGAHQGLQGAASSLTPRAAFDCSPGNAGIREPRAAARASPASSRGGWRARRSRSVAPSKPHAPTMSLSMRAGERLGHACGCERSLT